MSVQPAVMVLGRNGDVLNALPIAYSLAKSGRRPQFLISKACSTLLAGVSYVDPVVWDGDYSKPAQAILWYKKRHPENPIIMAQCYMNGDQRHLTNSFQKESWRVAGWLDKFGTIPLVIDQRNPAREAALVDGLPLKPVILVCPDGISSKYVKAEELMTLLRETLEPEYHVLDLRTVRAERIYDLLGLYDHAALLVSVDTVHLHLARASQVPVLAITNLGWRGSVLPPTGVMNFPYDVGPKYIATAARDYLQSLGVMRTISHVADIFGTTERHLRARSTWTKFPVRTREWERTAREIGDPRNLPYLKDVLRFGMSDRKDLDITLWTNDDVGQAPEIEGWLRGHVAKWRAVSMRRNAPHMGRDLFAFRNDWLIQNWNLIPDFILGAPFWDLCLAAIIRKDRGINSTKENLEDDIFPCETEHRYALHEDHPSDWAKQEYTYPANQYNRRLFLEWCKKEMPSLKL